jgi:hypothetical protein
VLCGSVCVCVCVCVCGEGAVCLSIALCHSCPLNVNFSRFSCDQ